MGRTSHKVCSKAITFHDVPAIKGDAPIKGDSPISGDQILIDNEKTVFVANKPIDTAHPKEFVPMEHLGVDDELVYVPELCYSANGRACLSFEGWLQNV